MSAWHRAAPVGAALLLATLLTDAGGAAPERTPTDAPRGGPRLIHLPVKTHEAEQGILTAIPVRLELPPDVPGARALLHFWIRGGDRWVALQLRKTGSVFEGAIPCLEVSTITGDVAYYVRVHDAEGQVVAFSGTRSQPHRVRIVHDSARTAATEDRPRCPDPNDCPRGLPGCPSEEVERVPCASDRDCEGGLTCSFEGYCEAVHRPRTWLGVELAQDLGLVERTGVCSLASQEQRGSHCVRDDGTTYLGNPTLQNQSFAPALGPTRLILGLDRLASNHTSVGVRAGFAFRGEAPTARGGVPFVPWLCEVRASRWFGADPFAAPALRPAVHASLGWGRFDLSTRTRVREDPTTPSRQPRNPLEQDLELHQRAGDAHATVGVGLDVPLGRSASLTGELALGATFPYAAFLFLPRVGVRGGL